MSIFNYGDICRYICSYLSLDDICMFRRCNHQLHLFISGNFFYDLKTQYLIYLIRPSQMMGIVRDIGYRRYLKKKGWRAICHNYHIALMTAEYDQDIKLVRYILKTKFDKLGGRDPSYLVRTRSREIIDLAVKLGPLGVGLSQSSPQDAPARFASQTLAGASYLDRMLKEILVTRDEALIQWFEDKHIGDKIGEMIKHRRQGISYVNYLEWRDLLWERYSSRYRHYFYPVTDPITGKLPSEDVIFALRKRILSHKVYTRDFFTGDVNFDAYMITCFEECGYVYEGEYFIKYN